MKIPFTLRCTTLRRATALLLFSDDVGELLALCARLGDARLPEIHAVEGGFIIHLGREDDSLYPKTIRLRAVVANLLVPADAGLVPALLPDEAAALVRRQGLVFLPGGDVLSYAPERILGPGDLLHLPRLPRRAWLPLPARPRRAERINEILLDVPAPTAEGLLAGGGQGIGEAEPRPGASGTAATLAGHTLTGLGRGVAWLGQTLHWQALTRLGANLIQQGVAQAPRLSEALLGKQEAALRELLRRFREGNLDDALRHALPLHGQASGGGLAGSAMLPLQNIFYSLGALLGAGASLGGLWMSSSDVYESLGAEYRKAAEAATRRGDFKRAAYIYGKLLGEWRSAAAALERGGLHHDAAVLYLQKVFDVVAAARALEAGGDIDRALELYVQQGDHIAAGDLLSRAGESERAFEQYHLAAEAMTTRYSYLAAGELMLQRTARPDLAEAYFRAGWAMRSLAEPQGCLMHLLDLTARRTPSTALLELLGEADGFFAESGSDAQASAFYNRLCQVSEADHLAAQRETLRDRSLMALAARMRGRRGGATLVQSLFGSWEPALVRDAKVALRGRSKDRPARSLAMRTRTVTGQVTAVCGARLTGDVFIGFASGEIVRYDPVRGCVPLEVRDPYRIDALSVDDSASLLVAVLHDNGIGHVGVSIRLSDQSLGGSWGGVGNFTGPPLLTPVFSSDGRLVVGLYDGSLMTYLTGPDLVPELTLGLQLEPVAAMIQSRTGGARKRTFTLLFGTDRVSYLGTTTPGTPEENDNSNEPIYHHRAGVMLPWRLSSSEEVSMHPFAWSRPDGPTLEIAAVTEAGALGWAHLRLFDEPAVLASQQVGADPPFLCATLMPASIVVGVLPHGVARYALVEGRFRALPYIPVEVPDAVACFYSPPGRELVIVARRGDVVRVPLTE